MPNIVTGTDLFSSGLSLPEVQVLHMPREKANSLGLFFVFLPYDFTGFCLLDGKYKQFQGGVHSIMSQLFKLVLHSELSKNVPDFSTF